MPDLILTGNDYAKNPGLSVSALSSFLRDIDFQPPWRARADVDSDYYDSNQLDNPTLKLMEERGIPPIVVNLIAPTINLIIGMEAKVKRDWVVRADDDAQVDFAAAMTQKLQEAERGSNADSACSNAYAGQVKSGLHWVHVRKQKRNPYAYPYVVEDVHRREIWWDWHDMDPLLQQARWLVRRKWYDADVAKAQFPDRADVIDQVINGWSLFEDRSIMDTGHPLYQDWLSMRDFHWGVDQWRNLDRKRVAIYEVWYRVWATQPLLVLKTGQIVDVEQQDPFKMAVQAQLLQRGMGTIQVSTVPKMRLSYWVGPHRLSDIPSPMPHQDFPYIPFWGYREDRTGVPYGHIRAMRPMQDEINARRARMLWQLSARRLIGVDDAVDDKHAIESEVARPDAAIWLNGKRMAGRTIQQVLQVEENTSLNVQQMKAYEDAKETLQDVSNVFKEQLGKSGAADAGIAISQLIEQGTTSLAGMNKNYTFARTAVGNQLYALVKADIGDQEMAVTVERGMGAKKVVKLNERKWDDELQRTTRSNDVALSRAKVVLDDTAASATTRQMQFRDLLNLVGKLPSPELQAAVIDMVVMASDLPHRADIAKRIRATLGIQESDPAAMSPEEQKAFAERADAQELMDKLKETMALLAKERADLENRQIDANTELLEAKTAVERKKVGQMDADEEATREGTAANAATAAAGVHKTNTETDRLRREPIVDKSSVNPGIDPEKAHLRDVA